MSREVAANGGRGGYRAWRAHEPLRQLAEISLDELDPGRAFTDDTYTTALEWAKGRGATSDQRWHGIALLRFVPGSKETLWRDFDAVTTWATAGPHPVAGLRVEALATGLQPGCGSGDVAGRDGGADARVPGFGWTQRRGRRR